MLNEFNKVDSKSSKRKKVNEKSTTPGFNPRNVGISCQKAWYPPWWRVKDISITAGFNITFELSSLILKVLQEELCSNSKGLQQNEVLSNLCLTTTCSSIRLGNGWILKKIDEFSKNFFCYQKLLLKMQETVALFKSELN